MKRKYQRGFAPPLLVLGVFFGTVALVDSAQSVCKSAPQTAGCPK